jgi:Tfp pilus assembly protein PilF
MTVHARLAWQLLCALSPPRPGASACGNAPSAEAFSSESLIVPPNAFEFYIRGLMDSNDAQRLRNLREAARLLPQWDAPAFAIGDTFFSRRSCDSALPWLTRVSPSGPRAIRGGFQAGVCRLLLGDPARAQADFSAVLSRAPGPLPAEGRLLEAQNNLGVALARDGKTSEAVATFERVTRADAEEPDYWVNLALAQLRAQRPELAAESLQRALGLQPVDNEARALLALALEQTGRAAEAQAERDALSRASARVVLPRNPAASDFARFDRIRMRLDAGALRPQPSDSGETADTMRGRQRLQFHLDRGRQYLDSGNLDDAQRAFIEALLLAPLDFSAHVGLAQVYDRQGRPNDGVREYRAALASRDDLPTRIALAQVLLRQDRRAEARAELQLVLSRDPGNTQAQDLLDELSNAANGSPPGGSP